jgi:glycine/D-amino acid oxidase-like deaminating enzyme
MVSAERVLLATNAGSRELAGRIYQAKESAEPRLTFAIATAPLRKRQITSLGMDSGRPFYTVDVPYLWGRLLKNDGMIFGSGLLPALGEWLRGDAKERKSTNLRVKKLWSGLEEFDVQKGEAAARVRSLEQRVRHLHPVLEKIRITHRWAGPIMITDKFMTVFRRHPDSRQVIVLGGYSGHGVALSVYLGDWAAQVLLSRRDLPRWPSL